MYKFHYWLPYRIDSYRFYLSSKYTLQLKHIYSRMRWSQHCTDCQTVLKRFIELSQQLSVSRIHCLNNCQYHASIVRATERIIKWIHLQIRNDKHREGYTLHHAYTNELCRCYLARQQGKYQIHLVIVNSFKHYNFLIILSYYVIVLCF